MLSKSHSLLVIDKTTGGASGGRLLSTPSYNALRQKGHGGSKKPRGQTVLGGRRWKGRLVTAPKPKNWKYDKPEMPIYAFGAENTNPALIRNKAANEYFQMTEDFEKAISSLGVAKNFDETVGVWYNTNDLRLHDHYPCALAVDEAELRGCPLVAMFCFDVRTFAQPSLLGGFYRQSPLRADYLIRTIKELRESFRKNGTELFVRVGLPEIEIPLLSQQLGCAQVFSSTQYAPHENYIQDEVRKKLTVLDIINDSEATTNSSSSSSILKTVWNTTLTHIDDLASPVSEMPDRFRLYWDENENARVRPTNPYDCSDGRLLDRVAKNTSMGSSLLNPVLYKDSQDTAGLMSFSEESIIAANKIITTTTTSTIESESENFVNDETKNVKNVSIIFVGPQSEEKYGVISNSGSLGEIMKQRKRTILLPPSLVSSKQNQEESAAIASEVKENEATTENSQYNIVPSGAMPLLGEHLGYGNGTEYVSVDDHGNTHFGAGEEFFLNEHFPDWLVRRNGIREYAALGDVEKTRVIQYARFQGKLSAWLSNGSLSPRKLYEMIREYSFNKMGQGTTEYATRELHMRLGRRDFWHFQGVKYGRAFFFPFGPRPDETDDVADPRYDKKIVQRWCSGLTGIPFVDASMKELTSTGWCNMNSRRAMLWTLTRGYGQDWRLGAEWLERTSIDYDPFVCYGNCMYEAGILKDRFGDQPRSVGWLANHFDGTGVYTKRWLPLLCNVPDFYLHRVHVMTPKMQKMHGVILGKNYPYPVKLWDGALENEALPLPAYFTDFDEKINNKNNDENNNENQQQQQQQQQQQEEYEKDLENRFDNCTREKQLRKKISSVHVDARRGSNMLDNKRIGWGEAKRHNKNLLENQLFRAKQYYHYDDNETTNNTSNEEKKKFSLLMKKSDVFPSLSEVAIGIGEKIEAGEYQPVFEDEHVLVEKKKNIESVKLKQIEAQLESGSEHEREELRIYSRYHHVKK